MAGVEVIQNQSISGTLSVADTTVLSTIANATGDTNKFLVSDSGTVKYRTGAQVLADIGAGTGSGSVTSVNVKTDGDSMDTASNSITGSGTCTIPWQGTASQYVNGAGNLTALSTLPQGTVTGTGAANRLAIWSGSSSLTSDSDLTYSDTNYLALNGFIQQGVSNLKNRTYSIEDSGGADSYYLLGQIEDSGNTDGACTGTIHFAYDYGSTSNNCTVHFNFAQRSGTARGTWWYESDEQEASADRVHVQLIDDGAGNMYIWVVVKDYNKCAIETWWRSGEGIVDSGQLSSATVTAGTTLFDTADDPTAEMHTGDLYTSGSVIYDSHDGATCSLVDATKYVCYDTGTSVNSKIGYFVTNYPDGSYVTFGDATGGDLQIYHNGNNYLKSSTKFDFNVVELDINDYAGTTNYMDVGPTGVTLYHSGSTKLATSGTGVTITGGFSTSASSSCAGLNMTADIAMAGNDITLDSDSNIELDMTLSSGESSGNIIKYGSGTLTAGKVYYANSSMGLQWAAVNHTSANSTKMLALALGTSAVSNGVLLNGIYCKTMHGFTIGAPLYLSSSDGDFTTTVPGSGDYARVLGYAIDSNHIYFCPDNTWVKID